MIATKSQHSVQFYQGDSFLMKALTPELTDAVGQGHAVLVVATPAHRAALRRELKNAGLSIDGLKAAGRLHFRDADRMLSSFLVGGWPDAARFDRTVGRAVRSLMRRHGGLHAFGEMVDLLWQRDRRDAAVELESLWNGLLRRSSFRLSCAYRADVLDPTIQVEHLEGAFGTHGHVGIAESPGDLREAFFAAVNRVVPSNHVEMLESWLANGRFDENDAVPQAVVWLRRFMPELSSPVLSLTRRLLRLSAQPRSTR